MYGTYVHFEYILCDGWNDDVSKLQKCNFWSSNHKSFLQGILQIIHLHFCILQITNTNVLAYRIIDQRCADFNSMDIFLPMSANFTYNIKLRQINKVDTEIKLRIWTGADTDCASFQWHPLQAAQHNKLVNKFHTISFCGQHVSTLCTALLHSILPLVTTDYLLVVFMSKSVKQSTLNTFSVTGDWK